MSTAITTAWENLTHHGTGTATEARTRLAHVFDSDPFVAMFSPHIRATMVEGFLWSLAAPARAQVEDAISAADHADVRGAATRAVRVMPLGFTTDGFRDHLISLVAFALIPYPERDSFGRPI